MYIYWNRPALQSSRLLISSVSSTWEAFRWPVLATAGFAKNLTNANSFSCRLSETMVELEDQESKGYVNFFLRLPKCQETHEVLALLRSWPAAAIVLTYAIAAIAAGISTSYAVDTTNLEVLVDSPLCRLLNVSGLAADANASTAFSTGISPYIHTYTQNCYINKTVPPAGCRNIFVQPKISIDVQPAACPWQSSMCLEEQQPAIAMDSGLVDVSREFGLNLRSRDNLWVRRKTTCNVLPLKGHEDQIDLNTVGGNSMYFETLPDEKGVGYRFGNYTDLPPEAYPEYLLKMSLLTANRAKSYSSK